MIGVLSGYFLFSAFVDNTNPQSTAWLSVYYILAVIAMIAFVLLLTTPVNERSVRHEDTKSLVDDLPDMFRLAVTPVVVKSYSYQRLLASKWPVFWRHRRRQGGFWPVCFWAKFPGIGC
ncbi:hypothetical protein [Spirosoma endophyticum]|uniref:hypothetical protein n=1 Tax=Spirosoma endophyticum TaxID=662367 RepID=UPI001FE94DFA|nr:hypothetical protein [Spirosoma endophyticum]